MTVKNIDWDTDGEEVELPKTVKLPKNFVDDNTTAIADYLSDRFGWCVSSFEFA